MFLKLLKSKLHRARVTSTKVDYPGSIGIDSELMAAAGIVSYEKVLVADLTNGNRLETYVVPAEAGSKQIEVLGAAAHLIEVKDIVIIMGFGLFTPEEARVHKVQVVVLDENNDIINSN
jgi:aspartate 1-decarboxylase